MPDCQASKGLTDALETAWSGFSVSASISVSASVSKWTDVGLRLMRCYPQAACNVARKH
jgi:hypothetical protein